MIGIVDAAATVALVATIQGQSVGGALWGGLAIERFGQCPGHALQFADRIACEQIGMSQPISLQAALEQLGDPGLFCKIRKHGLILSLHGLLVN
jgi:hypothetical protein